MPKPINADEAARRIIERGQPVFNEKFTPTPDPRQGPPTKKSLPADLHRALGQS